MREVGGKGFELDVARPVVHRSEALDQRRESGLRVLVTE
jgi:hypothetical protein